MGISIMEVSEKAVKLRSSKANVCKILLIRELAISGVIVTNDRSKMMENTVAWKESAMTYRAFFISHKKRSTDGHQQRCPLRTTSCQL